MHLSQTRDALGSPGLGTHSAHPDGAERECECIHCYSLLRARLRGGGIDAIADIHANLPKGALLRVKVSLPALLVPGCPGALAELLNELLVDAGCFELVAAPSPLLVAALGGEALGLLLDSAVDPVYLRSG